MNALVAYSGSESEDTSDEENVAPCPKRPRKEVGEKSRDVLPLPSDILRMFDDDEEKDSKESHMGRTRTFAHVAGNWATYLSIPFSCDGRFIRCLEQLCGYLTDQYPVATGHAEFHVIPLCDLHVTVSRTVPIRHHWIEPLTGKLKNGLSKHHSFSYQLSDLEVYCNDTKTRSFIGLEILFGHENFLELVKTIDDEFQHFRLPKYYEDPSFHLSILWCLGDVRELFHKSALQKLQAQWNKLLQEHGIGTFSEHPATEVHCKCGNKCFKFSLKSHNPPCEQPKNNI